MSSRTLAHGIAKLLRATNYRSTGEANLANWNIPTIGFPFPEKSIRFFLSNLDSSPTYIINNILACSPTFLPASKPWKKFPHESNYGGKTRNPLSILDLASASFVFDLPTADLKGSTIQRG